MEVKGAESIEDLKMLDLEEMAFAQGSHLLSNKKCKLPEKSFKAVKKGFEEIHIPHSKPEEIHPDERLVPIEELPH